MALTVDAVSEASVATASFSHTVAADANIILALIGFRGGTVSGCTYNGVAMTKAAEHGYNTYTGAIYYLLSPATGSNTVAFSVSGTGNYACGAISMKGADLLAPINVTNGMQGTGTPTTSLTPTIDGCIGLDAWYSQSNAYFSFTYSEIFQSNPNSDTDRAGGSYRSMPTANTEYTLTTSGGQAGQEYGGCGVVVSPETPRAKLVTFY